MPTVQHNALTTAELHEPKGVAAATANETYVADGAGSGSWSEPEPKDVTAAAANKVYVTDGAASGAMENITEYGSIYTQESDAVSVATIGTTVKTLPFSNDGPDKGAVSDQTNNRITLTNAGDYKIDFVLSFATAAAADAGLYEFTIELDGVNTVLNAKIQMSGTTDTSVLSISGILTATAGQQLTVEVVSDEAGDTDDISIVSASLSAVLLK